ncbi:S24 family peptidase [Pseudomonas sp. R2.Fl]|nr:S24 family peptidase [Pseudomonas sp. R2.Fl]
MRELLAPAIPAEHIMSDRLRVWMVDGDGMAPDLRSRRDYVMIAPCDRYSGGGVYLVDWGCGPTLYRVQFVGGGKSIRMYFDNPLYRHGEAEGGNYFTVDEFNEMVLGFVVADVKVRHAHMLREAVEGRR